MEDGEAVVLKCAFVSMSATAEVDPDVRVTGTRDQCCMEGTRMLTEHKRRELRKGKND